jgi:hypothetical protein
MPIYIHEATVETIMDFPIDMLRYDSCFPADQNSVNEMVEMGNVHLRNEKRKEGGKWRINIRKLSSSKTHGFTEARWKSFQCKLTKVKVFKR